MALTVEDGTVVTDANTYVSVDYVDSYCELRGLVAWTASTDTDTKEQAILRAMDYIESRPFKGTKSEYENPCEFPRVGLYLNSQTYNYTVNGYTISNYLVEDNEIPANLKKAQSQAAYEEFMSPGCLQINMDKDSFVIRKKIDVIETEYQSGKEETIYKKVDSFLKDLVNPILSSTVLRT